MQRVMRALPLIAVLLCPLLTTACTQLLFQPLQQQVYSPTSVDLAYDDIYAVTADGVHLHGWKLHLPEQRSQQPHAGSLIFFHGNGENISTQFGNVYWLVEYGYDVYLFDYRGYGASQGVPDLDAIVADYDVMLASVLGRIPKAEKLIIMGHSFGAALSIYGVAHSQYRARIAGLISVAAFADYHDVTREVLARSWLTWALQWPLSWTIDNSYRPLDSVAQISPLPLLIMHSRDDEIINIHHGKDLFAAARSPRSFIEMRGDHNHSFNLASNRELLLGYLDQLALQVSSAGDQPADSALSGNTTGLIFH